MCCDTASGKAGGTVTDRERFSAAKVAGTCASAAGRFVVEWEVKRFNAADTGKVVFKIVKEQKKNRIHFLVIIIPSPQNNRIRIMTRTDGTNVSREDE